MSTISRLWAKLRDRKRRHAFVLSQIAIGIPFQLQALLKSRGWTQQELARKAGMKQPRISDLLKPGKVRPNIETLRRLAEAFDCGLIVRFAPFSDLASWSQAFDPERFSVLEFEREDALLYSGTKVSIVTDGTPHAIPPPDSVDRTWLIQDATPAQRKLPASQQGTAQRYQIYA